MTTIGVPYVVWSIAVVCLHDFEKKHAVFPQLVFGTADFEDAKAIAISRIERGWDESKFGPRDFWTLQDHTVSGVSATVSRN